MKDVGSIHGGVAFETSQFYGWKSVKKFDIYCKIFDSNVRNFVWHPDIVVVLHPFRVSNLFVNFFYSVVYFLFLVNVWYFCSLDEISNLLGHSSSPADACSFCLPWNAETRQEQHVFQKKDIHLNKILTKEESFHLAPQAQTFQNTTQLHPSPQKIFWYTFYF